MRLGRAGSVATVAALVASHVANAALPPIEIKGSKFFKPNGDQFYIKGVTYQPLGASGAPNGLSNGAQCKIDAKLIGDLGANVIRVYSVDPTLNHTDCMQAFDDAGVYVIVDMSTPSIQIDRTNPDWNLTLRDQFARVVDGFNGYDNLLAFFAGNEIVSDRTTSDAALYAKAAIADMKAYRDAMQYRSIPIGYSAADLANLRKLQMDYFTCREGSADTSADFYAFNSYAWCGPSTFTQSGYDQLYKEAKDLDVPIFMSETGCNLDNRTWEDQVAMLGRDMNDRYSGNIIYEWSQESNGYGIVSYQNSDDPTGTPSIMPDYTRLQSQWATLNPTGVKASTYSPSLTKTPCPGSTSGVWNITKNAAVPTLGLSGFSTPTAVRSTRSGGNLAGAQTAAGTAGGTATTGSPLQSNNSTKDSNVGVIAGGVVGGIVAIILLVALLWFLRRRKRKQHEPVPQGPGGPQNPYSDKMPAVSNPDAGAKIAQNGYHGPVQHELSEQQGIRELDPTHSHITELDPARGQVAPLPANELPLQNGGPEENIAHDSSRHHAHAIPTAAAATSTPAPPEPSPFVQAQRNTELQWLESEEARLRQRREVLMNQNNR